MNWSRHSLISRDMAADARAEIGGATLYHTQGIDRVHRIVRRSANAAGGRAQEGALLPFSWLRGPNQGMFEG